MKPIIGLTANQSKEANNSMLAEDYYMSVVQAGGIPNIIPVITELPVIDEIIKNVDGIILTGGADVDPLYFGEEPMEQLGEVVPKRDCQEIYIAKKCIENNIPVLGICRGIQVLNIAGNGTIYQDIATQVQNIKNIKHSQNAPRWHGTHKVKICKNTKTKAVLQEEAIIVNSFHHQAVKKVAENFTVTATSDDGIIEGIEHNSNDYCIGVQWHPEAMWKRNDGFLNLFKALINSAVKYHNGKGE